MDDEMRALNLAVDEAGAFLERHPEVGNYPFGTASAVAFGMLRAIAECPRCPGTFRVPTVEPPDGWYCHRCEGLWVPLPPEIKVFKRRAGKSQTSRACEKNGG